MRGIQIGIDCVAPLEVLDEGSLCLLVAEQTVRLPVAGIGRGEPPSKQGVGRGLDQAAAVLLHERRRHLAQTVHPLSVDPRPCGDEFGNRRLAVDLVPGPLGGVLRIQAVGDAPHLRAVARPLTETDAPRVNFLGHRQGAAVCRGEMAAIVHEVTQEAPGVLHILHVDDLVLVLPLLLRGIRVGAPALVFHHHAHNVWLASRDTLQHLGVGHGVDVRVAGSEDDRRQALVPIGGADGVHDLLAFVHLHQAAVHIPAVVREVLRVCTVVLDILDLKPKVRACRR